MQEKHTSSISSSTHYDNLQSWVVQNLDLKKKKKQPYEIERADIDKRQPYEQVLFFYGCVASSQ